MAPSGMGAEGWHPVEWVPKDGTQWNGCRRMAPRGMGAEGWHPGEWVPKEELGIEDTQRNGRGHHACAADGVFG